MPETTLFWTVIGTGVGGTGLILTVLLTVLTMQGRAINARIDDLRDHSNKRTDDQNVMIQGRFDDMNVMIQGRFEDQNRRLDDMNSQWGGMATEVRELRSQVFDTLKDRQPAAQ